MKQGSLIVFFWHIANDILIIQYNRILILGSQSQQNKDDR